MFGVGSFILPLIDAAPWQRPLVDATFSYIWKYPPFPADAAFSQSQQGGGIKSLSIVFLLRNTPEYNCDHSACRGIKTIVFKTNKLNPTVVSFFSFHGIFFFFFLVER